jgi:hypothetical protein
LQETVARQWFGLYWEITERSLNEDAVQQSVNRTAYVCEEKRKAKDRMQRDKPGAKALKELGA